MWPSSIWKSSSPKNASKDDVNNPAASSIKEPGAENVNGCSHLLSLSTLRGNTSVSGMMTSALSSTLHSASSLNAESFVASTPAPPIHPYQNSASTSVEYTSYSNATHEQFQSSSQIESAQVQKDEGSDIQIQSKKDPLELDSINQTPSRFQLPPGGKEKYLRDSADTTPLHQVNTLCH